MKLQDISAGMRVIGIEPDTAVEIIDIRPIGQANYEVTYKSDATGVRHCMLPSDLAGLAQAQPARAWNFAADARQYKLALEAKRIDMARFFDPMMAMHSANVDPLPHQISAVYERMLPQMPLRFVLADDPGAGKTIMTGLLASELIMREDAHRVLVVAPGSLVEQWAAELAEKFGLRFEIFNRHSQEESAINLFAAKNHFIARLDQLARDEAIQQKLLQTEWDLVVIDEAHKMSARAKGATLDKTKRFLLGERLRDRTRHLLLLTATPHNGIEEQFNNFMSLLDAERFCPARDKTNKADVAGVMRRVVKEQLVKFDGRKLFPERTSETIQYTLSEAEAALYENVTAYVRTEMNRADSTPDKKRRGSVGFAMTALQRRLASSPLAIWQSLARRHEKLKASLQELRAGARPASIAAPLLEDDFDEDDWMADEAEQREQEILHGATAAQSARELEAEIRALAALKSEAKRLKESGGDKKWEQLSQLLQDPRLRGADGAQRKLIVFTEYRDTLTYLQDKIGGVLGDPAAVLAIHGGLARDKRRENQERFWHDAAARVLLATDAAGEGINLQVANLMVNYDLPWNPNRLEQRFGRIHRIGQTRRCRLWNMVAARTREGEVFYRLLAKIEQQEKTLGQFGGRVYDILGEIFEDKPLRALLWEAIRAESAAAGEERAAAELETLFDMPRLRQIAERDALFEQPISTAQVAAMREQLEKAQARKLQPHFVSAFFRAAFAGLGGAMHQREPNRYEIRHVPASIRQYDKSRRERDIRHPAPVLPSYERVSFDKRHIRPANAPMASPADTLHPAHPLMRAVIDLCQANSQTHLQQGAVLADDSATAPRLIFVVEHRIMEADNNRTASAELQFVSTDESGRFACEGWAPYLDCRPPKDPQETALAQSVMRQPWVAAAGEGIAGYAADHLAAPHYQRVRARRREMLQKEENAVHTRLQQVITAENQRFLRAQQDAKSGAAPQVNADNIARRIEDLEQRGKNRKAQLKRRANLQSLPPRIASAMLIIPAAQPQTAADAAARQEIERRAMAAVVAHERALGHTVIDVSEQNCGWDITSIPPAAADGAARPSRHIEVKGRQKNSATITVTRNEILSAFNQGDSFILAIVIIDGEEAQTHYVHRPFAKEPDADAASVNYQIAPLLKRAIPPQHSAHLCAQGATP